MFTQCTKPTRTYRVKYRKKKFPNFAREFYFFVRELRHDAQYVNGKNICRISCWRTKRAWKILRKLGTANNFSHLLWKEIESNDLTNVEQMTTIDMPQQPLKP